MKNSLYVLDVTRWYPSSNIYKHSIQWIYTKFFSSPNAIKGAF